MTFPTLRSLVLDILFLFTILWTCVAIRYSCGFTCCEFSPTQVRQILRKLKFQVVHLTFTSSTQRFYVVAYLTATVSPGSRVSHFPCFNQLSSLRCSLWLCFSKKSSWRQLPWWGIIMQFHWEHQF